MVSPVIDTPLPRFSVQRFFWGPLGVSVVLAFLVLAVLAVMSWRSLERLQPIQDHLAHIARIQELGLSMEQTLVEHLGGGRGVPPVLAALSDRVQAIADVEGAMDPATGQRLRQIVRAIDRAQPIATETLFSILARLREVLAAERARHDELLLEVTAGTRMELRLFEILLVVFPLVSGVALFLLQHRVEQPLKDLQYLLTRLSGRDYRPVPEVVLQRSARLAQPAFYSYNALVSRLQDLEEEHRDRELTLERRVRTATEALLAQSRELSRAERLAAVGAVSAGLAHELRNPLAGILLACSKLQPALADQAQSARLAAVINELHRIGRLLTEQVEAARHAPEALAEVDIGAAVDQLLALLRYQVPPGVALVAHIEPELRCWLPAAGLRQALLNLVLNAVQIQGDTGSVEIIGSRDDQGRLTLQVRDEGPGFPEQTLRVGIRPFATGRAGGTGLGLAMVRRFVRDLDGELTLENSDPRGAQVTLHLPCAPAPVQGEEAHA